MYCSPGYNYLSLGYSEWVIVVKCQVSNISAVSWCEHAAFWWDNDDFSIEQDQHTQLEFYSDSVTPTWTHYPDSK